MTCTMTKDEFNAELACNPHLIVTCQAAQDAALAQARGCYQRALLTGYETLSGAGLRGKANSYAARYAASRRSLFERMDAAGIPFFEARGRYGKRILVLGPVPTASEAAA